jgi:hypothetical protein
VIVVVLLFKKCKEVTTRLKKMFTGREREKERDLTHKTNLQTPDTLLDKSISIFSICPRNLMVVSWWTFVNQGHPPCIYKRSLLALWDKLAYHTIFLMRRFVTVLNKAVHDNLQTKYS